MRLNRRGDDNHCLGGVCPVAQRRAAVEGPGQGGEHGGAVRCSCNPQVRQSESSDQKYFITTNLRCLLASEGEGGAAVLVRSQIGNGKLVIGQEGGAASRIMEKVQH